MSSAIQAMLTLTRSAWKTDRQSNAVEKVPQ